MKRVIAFCLLLVGCGYQVNDYTPQLGMSQGPTRDRVVLTVRWAANIDELALACSTGVTLGDCTKCDEIEGQRFCTIYLQQPKDFNDVPRLAYAGHGLLHALGARH